MAVFNVKGDIVSDDIGWIYDWYEMDYTSPAKLKAVINSLEDGETLTVKVNSGGGDVQAGQEIYSMLSEIKDRVVVEIESMAASAASFLAMAGGTVKISPVAMIMIHNTATYCQGDYNVMLHTAEVLQNVNSAIAQAYVLKTGKTEEEILDLMNKETWLTANQCLEYGFVDEIINQSNDNQFINTIGALSITTEMIENAKKEKSKIKNEKEEILNDLYKYGITE